MFGITDLDDIIYLQLKPNDLTRCARVSKKWHSIVIPYLWRDLRWCFNSSPGTMDTFCRMIAEDYHHELWQQHPWETEQSDTKPTQSPSSPFSSALTKYGHWIRKTPAPKSLISFLHHPSHTFDNWAELPIESRRDPTPDELLRHFYKRCNNTIQVDSMDLQHEDFATNLWKTITDHAVLHVQHLNIALYGLVVKVDSWKLKYALDRLSVTLETLTIQLDTDSLENGEGSSEIKSWTSLKELKLLKYRNTTDTGSFWSWLWTRCGHVETLEVSTVGEGNAQNLAEVIQTHMPNLDTIRLRQGDDRFRLEDEHIATLLSGPYHGWKTVDMSRNVGIGRLSLEALTNHFPTLVELKVDGCSGFSGESLVQVLSSCPNLRSLVAISNGNFPSQTKFLAVDAKVFIDRDRSTGSLKTWSCESMLKVLKVKIGNIPRPELTLPNTNQETYLGQGQEIQNLVYERLGRLTSLQVLWLGHDPYFTAGVPQNEDRALQMNCLEMSLESGLGRLSGLKEMKELGMSRMRKNTGMKEIQWMKKHWPKLEKTHGLDTGNGAKESELRWKILRDQRNQMHAVTWARRALDARSNGSSTTSYTCGDFHRR